MTGIAHAMQDPTNPGREISRRLTPLNRDEQTRVFAEYQKQQAFGNNGHAPLPPPPPIELNARQEAKLPPKQALRQYEDRLQTQNLVQEVAKIKEEIKETETKETIKKFYCTHSFKQVSATFMGIPIKQKICSKCDIVK